MATFRFTDRFSRALRGADEDRHRDVMMEQRDVELEDYLEQNVDQMDASRLTRGTIPTARIADGAITSAKIGDNTIVNADINGLAGIAWSKLGAPPWCRLARTATYQVFGPGEQDIVWTTEVNDTHGYYPGSGSTITVPAGYEGIHAITATVDMAAGISANGYIKLVVNGFIFAAFQTVGNDKCSVSATVYVPAGGTIYVTGYNPSNGLHRGWIEVTRIGSSS